LATDRLSTAKPFFQRLRDALDAQSRLFLLGSALLAFLMYLLTAWFLLLPEAFWSPDEGAKWLQLQSWHWGPEGPQFEIPYPGREIDPELQFAQADPAPRLLTLRNQALYFQRLSVFALVERPFFRWLGFRGLCLVPVLAGAAIGLLTLAFLPPGDRRRTMWLLVVLGSPVTIYAMMFWEHTLATALALAGACLLVRGSSAGRFSWPRAGRYGLAGLLFAGAAYLRIETLLFSGALLLACALVVRPWRWELLVAGGTLALALLPYLPLHNVFFEQPLPDNAIYLFYPLTYLRSAGWQVLPDLLLGPPVEGALSTGSLGILWVATALVAIGHSFGSTSRAAAVLRGVALALSAAVAAYFLFLPAPYRSAHGLLFTTPWALLGLTRAPEVWRRGGPRARILVLTVALGLTGYVVGAAGLRASPPHGGLEWGARFALSFYPFLAILAAWVSPRSRSRSRTLMVALLVVFVLLGIGFQVRGIMTIRQDKIVIARVNRILADLPERYVVTDLWWLPFTAAPLSESKAIMVAAPSDRLPDWLELATAHGVDHFTMVTTGTVSPWLTKQWLSANDFYPVDYYHAGELLIVPVARGKP